MMTIRAWAYAFLFTTVAASFSSHANQQTKPNNTKSADLNFRGSAFSFDLVNAALERLSHKVTYDGSYREIAFPWGDVPDNIGVCTDVVIRSYRKLGIDLQERVNLDMSIGFNQYPNLPKWDRTGPDTNIDHRRVYNLRVFFARNGSSLPITDDSNDYWPGDLVTWDMMPGMPHIGVITHKTSNDKKRPLIVHNMGEGPKLEDILFTMKITGHYRYRPDK
jgi:uncharacterized protein YijF (DUF1287 family)